MNAGKLCSHKFIHTTCDARVEREYESNKRIAQAKVVETTHMRQKRAYLSGKIHRGNENAHHTALGIFVYLPWLWKMTKQTRARFPKLALLHRTSPCDLLCKAFEAGHRLLPETIARLARVIWYGSYPALFLMESINARLFIWDFSLNLLIISLQRHGSLVAAFLRMQNPSYRSLKPCRFSPNNA